MVQRRSRISRRKNRSRISRRKNRSRVSRRKNRSRVSRRKNRSRVVSRKGRRKKIKKMKSKLYQSGGSSNLGSFRAQDLDHYGVPELEELALHIGISKRVIDNMKARTPPPLLQEKMISFIIEFREKEQEKRVQTADNKLEMATLRVDIAKLNEKIYDLDTHPSKENDKKKRRLTLEKEEKERKIAEIEARGS